MSWLWLGRHPLTQKLEMGLHIEACSSWMTSSPWKHTQVSLVEWHREQSCLVILAEASLWSPEWIADQLRCVSSRSFCYMWLKFCPCLVHGIILLVECWYMYKVCLFFFPVFVLHDAACGILVSDQSLNPGAWQWEQRVLYWTVFFHFFFF